MSRGIEPTRIESHGYRVIIGPKTLQQNGKSVTIRLILKS